MKVILLCNGGYSGIPQEALGEPVEAVQCPTADGYYDILGSELIRVGAHKGAFGLNSFYSFSPNEVQILS